MSPHLGPLPYTYTFSKTSCQKWRNSVISEEDELSIHAICFKEEFAAFLNHESMHVYGKA
jgi:hypothetical protein